MPRRTDITHVLVIGSGPIVIGQACEFDYSGTQACRVLREEGIRVSLINSNPATIMTDPEFADATYIEPINAEFVEKVLADQAARGFPVDAVLATLGGQTALNTAIALDERGVLEKYGVELIGADIPAINRGEDRQIFKDVVRSVGGDVPRSAVCHTMDEVRAAVADLGLPVVDPAVLHHGRAGLRNGLHPRRSRADRRPRAGRVAGVLRPGQNDGPAKSAGHAGPASLGNVHASVLIEESVLGWKEYELELMRDGTDNAVVVCSIENLDPMGVHTGDSITVAPAMTLTDREYQRMRDLGLAILRAVGVATGGCNIQFAINPDNGRIIVIEMNPAGLPVVGVGVQGDRLPDRQDRGQAGHRLHPGRDRQRHHQGHPGGVRADAGLRGGEDPAVRVREVPGCRPDADHHDEVGRRGDVDRPVVRRGAGQGDAVDGDQAVRVLDRARTVGRPATWTALLDGAEDPD